MRLKKSYLAALGVSLMLILGACQSDDHEEQDNQEPTQEKESGNEDEPESGNTEENENEDGSDDDKVEDIFEGGE
ncbi:hypothetical protein [Oceanobacillus timonensis]|uniref:hypothetical protein n=1 Tax=Oceanobacillus timonensis TaxID=1926285 RepID=UPI0009BB6809|nr:hypothetical protein [Oceanobacillus timonensis]